MTVEIIGRACVAAGVESVVAFADVLKAGRKTVTSIPRGRFEQARFWHPSVGVPGKAYTFAAGIVDDIYAIDPELFGLSKREASYMDPQQRLLLRLVWQALEDASLSAEALSNGRVGVYVGASSLDNGNLFTEDLAAGGPYLMTGNTLSIVSNRISHAFGLRGPSMIIDTACSSSLVALDQAVKSLQSGDIDTAIVAGVNVLTHPFAYVGFSQARMLSPEGLCRAFGKNGEGYVRAEGGAVVVLRRTECVERNGDRSHARIVATGVNSAGRTNGISLPSREAQAALLHTIYREGDLDPNHLAFIEAHGTGTRVGDPAEAWALGTIIGQARRAPLPIGSVKTNIGHTEPASGLMGLFKAMISLDQDFVPASLHADELNDEIDFKGLKLSVNTTPADLVGMRGERLVGVNSFGFGGTNAHIVISDTTVTTTSPQTENVSSIFVVSAHTRSALDTLLAEYKARLNGAEPEEAQKIVNAATGNRAGLTHRFVVPSADTQSVVEAINNHFEVQDGLYSEIGEAPSRTIKAAFVYSGNGSQWAGMGVDALHRNRSFEEYFRKYSDTFETHLGLSLVDALESEYLEELLSDTKIAQPLLFAIQAALTDCFTEAGITPAAVFGHSVGEIAAAYAAGILTAEQAIQIVAARSRSQDLLAGQGTMAAVIQSASWVEDIAKRYQLKSICVAALNGPNSLTISGDRLEIERLRDIAKDQRVVVRLLDINYPFHHPMIDKAKSGFLSGCSSIVPTGGKIPFISTVHGRVSKGEELDLAYWWSNVREPVLFQDGTATALEHGCNLFIEFGPRPILRNYIVETSKQMSRKAAVLPTLIRAETDSGLDPVENAIAKAIAFGARFGGGTLRSARNAFVELPSLPFENQELRPTATSDKIHLWGQQDDDEYSLLGWQVDPKGNSWKNHLDARLFPDLAEHIVDGRSIVPGSGFIEIVVTAAKRVFNSDVVDLTNLEVLRPLALSSKRIVEMWTVVSPETGTVEVRSREYLSEDDWTLHAVARIRKPLAAPSRDRFVAVEGQGVKRVTSQDIYKAAVQCGLDYGPRFRLIKNADYDAVAKRIYVELDEPGARGNPYCEYSLNPMSLDCCFQGIISAFYDLIQDQQSSPYVPVRFGTINVTSSARTIRRAVIDIVRLDGNSIKANFKIYDDNGDLVLTLADCRFRKVSTRRNKTLETTGFHYEEVSSALNLLVRNSRSLPVFFSDLEDENETEATLLLDAAVYRACFDIVKKLADTSDRLSIEGPSDSRLPNAFTANCLYTLEDAGFITQENDNWVLPNLIEIPQFDELVRRISAKHPSCVVDIVLINDAYRSALKMLQPDDFEDEHATILLSDATLEHYETQSSFADKRAQILLGALNCLKTGDPSRGQLNLIELGALSVGHSKSLARYTQSSGSLLTVVEPKPNLHKTLEIAFDGSASTSVINDLSLARQLPCDVMVSCSGRLFQMLQENVDLRQFIRSRVEMGAKLLVVDPAPSIQSDFIFGLTGDWFDNSANSLFPTGRIANKDQWTRAFKEVGITNLIVREIVTAQGAALAIETENTSSIRPDVRPNTNDTFLCLTRQASQLFAQTDVKLNLLDVDYGPDDKVETLLSQLTKPPYDLSAIYFVEIDSRKASDVIQDHVLRLSLFAEAMKLHLQNSDVTSSQKPKLFVVAPGGAPFAGAHTSAVATAVWTFARVLQNEYDFIDVHLIDADPSSPILPSLLVHLNEGLNENREFIVAREDNHISEVRVVRGPYPEDLELGASFEAATIIQGTPGRVESIDWHSTARPEPLGNEVLVEVAATGLNFRDVMWAMGLLPEEALEDGFAGATIGMEFAGTVISTGPDVTDLKSGDRVMGIAPAAFSTHVKVERAGVSKVPNTLDLVSAATLPVAFLTAYYAIVELGCLRRGETILIHGAAGGVGLAALQVALWKGATVIATAGTDEKRDLLKALGAQHVFDSRTLNFVNETLEITQGEGVDVVLNSLFDEAMERSIELVKPFGRFLELGKRDYYSDRKIGLRPFRRNVSYFGIDADQLLIKEPEITTRIFDELGERFASGDFSALPYRAFDYSEIVSAFRLMQNAGHIGKILVKPPKSGRDQILSLGRMEKLDLAGGTCLVVGGIGGFGLVAANWAVSHGASHIALSSRRGIVDEETSSAIEAWAKLGVTASVHACDVTDEGSVDLLLNQLRKNGRITGVIHAAMVLDDALIANLSRERNRAVIDTKVSGADVLDLLTRKDDLRLFLMFSSATTMIGNPGQANYVAANGYLEGLVRERRNQGLVGLAVGFGAIGDTGFLTRNKTTSDILSKRIGRNALKGAEALRLVGDYIARSPKSDPSSAVVMISEMDFGALSSLTIARQPLFKAVMNQNEQIVVSEDGLQLDLSTMVAGKSASEAMIILQNVLVGEIAAILRVTQDTITPDKVLKDLGLDSLMAMELGLVLQQKTGLDLSLSGLNDGTTVNDVLKKLFDRVMRSVNASPENSEREGGELFTNLVAKHIGRDELTNA